MAVVLYDSLDKGVSVAFWSKSLDDTALNRDKITFINMGKRPHFLFANLYSAENNTDNASARVQIAQQSISFTSASQSGWFKLASNGASATAQVLAFF